MWLLARVQHLIAHRSCITTERGVPESRSRSSLELSSICQGTWKPTGSKARYRTANMNLPSCWDKQFSTGCRSTSIVAGTCRSLVWDLAPVFGAWQTWSSGRRRALVSRLGAEPVQLARETGPIGGCGEPSLALIVKRKKKVCTGLLLTETPSHFFRESDKNKCRTTCHQYEFVAALSSCIHITAT